MPGSRPGRAANGRRVRAASGERVGHLARPAVPEPVEHLPGLPGAPLGGAVLPAGGEDRRQVPEGGDDVEVALGLRVNLPAEVEGLPVPLLRLGQVAEFLEDAAEVVHRQRPVQVLLGEDDVERDVRRGLHVLAGVGLGRGVVPDGVVVGGQHAVAHAGDHVVVGELLPHQGERLLEAPPGLLELGPVPVLAALLRLRQGRLGVPPHAEELLVGPDRVAGDREALGGGRRGRDEEHDRGGRQPEDHEVPSHVPCLEKLTAAVKSACGCNRPWSNPCIRGIGWFTSTVSSKWLRVRCGSPPTIRPFSNHTTDRGSCSAVCGRTSRNHSRTAASSSGNFVSRATTNRVSRPVWCPLNA